MLILRKRLSTLLDVRVAERKIGLFLIKGNSLSTAKPPFDRDPRTGLRRAKIGLFLVKWYSLSTARGPPLDCARTGFSCTKSKRERARSALSLLPL